MYLSNLPRHMMEIHGITITRDQIYEFDYVLRRFNQLKEEIFGVDYITDLMDSESECSTDDINELTVTTSAMYCIKSISHHLKPPVSTDKTPEIVVSQPLSNRSVLSTHSVKSVKSELPSAESVNLLKSEPPSIEQILPPPVVVEEPIPFLRSRMHDPLMFDFITEDFAEEVLAENVQDELYDILDEMIEGEIVAREMEAYISQNLEAKSKAKKGKSQLSVDGKSLNEKTSSKSIKSKESKNSIKLEKKESRKKHKERNPSKTPSKMSTKTEKSTRSERSAKSEKSEKSVDSEGKKDRKKSKEKSKSKEDKEKRKKSKKKDAPVASSGKPSEISLSLADSLAVPDKPKKKGFWKKLFSK